ncbi:MAG: cytochrome b/b6 domain-containing protein [Usitatibacter sp.]
MAGRIRLWDAPVRLFHWTLAGLVVFSFVTGKLGGSWMQWHVRSGYFILVLLLFRLAWGLAGSDTARFSRFVRGPRAAAEYARAIWARRAPSVVGHNPLGGWMVVLMLAALLLQAATGLFADDDIATQGPLAAKVTNTTVARMTAIHNWNAWVIVSTAALHVLAIAIYQWGLKVNVLGPMVHGGVLPDGHGARRGSNALAAVLFVLACAAVYYLVVIYPRTP